jgi:hypothetical protein
VFDFLTFDGVHYIRWAEEPGRTLTREDLGIEFATVECSDPDYGTSSGPRSTWAR